MHKNPFYTKRSFLIGLYLLWSMILGACGQSTPGSTNISAPPSSSNGTPHPTTQGTTTAGATTPSIKAGAQPCPSTVSQPAYWNTKIPTQAGVNRVENVTCANLIGQSTLQALVQVRHSGNNAMLDLYVYNNITAAEPEEIFQISNLHNGEARISNYSTIITSETNQTTAAGKAQSRSQTAQNIQREFKWSNSARTLVPVAFPGIFPALTRFQAEADQQKVDQGQQAWKLDASKVARNFVANEKILNWQTNPTVKIISGGGKDDVNATVNAVNSSAPGKSTLIITMSRLEGKRGTGIWIVTGAQSNSMEISSPTASSTIKSPLTVQGKGNAFEGVIGTLSVLDSQYNTLGSTVVHGDTGNGYTMFTSTISYNSSMKTGTEEGLLLLANRSEADGSIAGIVIVKEILDS